jgi:hypothetical protein
LLPPVLVIHCLLKLKPSRTCLIRSGYNQYLCGIWFRLTPSYRFNAPQLVFTVEKLQWHKKMLHCAHKISTRR